MLVITLNELSLQIQLDIPAARDMMKKFVAAFTTASSEYHSELRLHSTIYLFNTEIAPNYLISQWIDDAQGDRPSQTRFRSILQKNFLIENSQDNLSLLDLWSYSEFYYNTQRCYGLGAAIILETLSISFPSNIQWDSTQLVVQHKYFEEYTEEKIIDGEDSASAQTMLREVVDTKNVNHFSTPNHFKSHIPWLQQKIKDLIKTGEDLWEKRAELFPKLIFCKETEVQIKAGHVPQYLPQVKKYLECLNRMSVDWTSEMGGFDYKNRAQKYGLNISPESDCTKSKYGRERTFAINDGTSRLFELHVKTGNFRLHFYPDETTRNIYIGYIGEHLNICT